MRLRNKVCCEHGKYFVTKHNHYELQTMFYKYPRIAENFGEICIITPNSTYYIYLPVWSSAAENICKYCSVRDEELLKALIELRNQGREFVSVREHRAIRLLLKHLFDLQGRILALVAEGVIANGV